MDFGDGSGLSIASRPEQASLDWRQPSPLRPCAGREIRSDMIVWSSHVHQNPQRKFDPCPDFRTNSFWSVAAPSSSFSLEMHFPPNGRTALLQVRRVGPKLVSRLEEMGFDSLNALSRANALDIVASASTPESTWKDCAQSCAGIQSAITFAQAHLGLLPFGRPSLEV